MPKQSTSERDRLRCLEVLRAIEIARRHIAGMSADAFAEDIKTQDAVAMRLLQIGEALASLSDATRALKPSIPWVQIVGMRHRLAHGYGEVDHSITWQTASAQLDALQRAVEDLLGALPAAPGA